MTPGKTLDSTEKTDQRQRRGQNAKGSKRSSLAALQNHRLQTVNLRDDIPFEQLEVLRPGSSLPEEWDHFPIVTPESALLSLL